METCVMYCRETEMETEKAYYFENQWGAYLERQPKGTWNLSFFALGSFGEWERLTEPPGWNQTMTGLTREALDLVLQQIRALPRRENQD